MGKRAIRGRDPRREKTVRRGERAPASEGRRIEGRESYMNATIGRASVVGTTAKAQRQAGGEVGHCGGDGRDAGGALRGTEGREHDASRQAKK